MVATKKNKHLYLYINVTVVVGPKTIVVVVWGPKEQKAKIEAFLSLFICDVLTILTFLIKMFHSIEKYTTNV